MSIIIVKIKLQKTDGLCLFVIQSDISINQSINYGQISIIQTGIVIKLLRFLLIQFNILLLYIFIVLASWFVPNSIISCCCLLFLEQHPNTSIWWPKKNWATINIHPGHPIYLERKKMVLHRHIDTCCCCWIVELEEKKIGKTPLVKIVRHRMSTFTTMTTMMMMTFHPFLLSCSGYTQNLCVFFHLCRRRRRCFFLWPVYTHTNTTPKLTSSWSFFLNGLVFFFTYPFHEDVDEQIVCVCHDHPRTRGFGAENRKKRFPTSS